MPYISYEIPITQKNEQSNSSPSEVVKWKLFINNLVSEIELEIFSNDSSGLVLSPITLKASITNSNTFISPLFLSLNLLPKHIFTSSIPIKNLINYLSDQTYLEYKKGTITSSPEQANIIKIKPIGLRGGSQNKSKQNDIHSQKPENNLLNSQEQLALDIQKAEEFIKEGLYQKSINTLQPWTLYLNNKFSQCELSTKIKALNTYSNGLLKNGQYEDSKTFIDHALTLLEDNCEAIPSQSLFKASIFEMLGKYEFQIGNFQKATDVHQQSLAIRLEKLGVLQIDTCNSYDQIGLCKQQVGKYKDAREAFGKSLEIRKKILEKNHIDFAHSYKYLGVLCKIESQYKEAIDNIELAIEILKINYKGSDHVEVGFALKELGYVYHCLQDNKKALKTYNQALELCSKFLDKDHPQLGNIAHNIGMEYLHFREYDKAIENFNRSLVIDLKVLGQDHPNIGLSYLNLGGVYQDQGKYQKAIEFHEKGIKILKAKYGDYHLSISDSYNNLGNIYHDLDDFKGALKCYEKSVNIVQHILGDMDPDLANTFSNMGLVYFKMEKYELSFKNYMKCIQIRSKVFGMQHPIMGDSFRSLAILLHRQSYNEQDIQLRKKQMLILKEQLNIDYQLEQQEDLIDSWYFMSELNMELDKVRRYNDSDIKNI